MSLDPHALGKAVGIVALVGFVLYRRIRRNFGPQRFSRRRLWIRIGILSAVCAAALGFHITSWQSWGAAVAGAVVGCGLGYVALRLTVFETTDKGRFFTPQPMIGIAVLAVFMGRFAYRFFVSSSDSASGGNAFVQTFANPLTLGIYFALAAYYISSYAGVLMRFREPPSPEAAF